VAGRDDRCTTRLPACNRERLRTSALRATRLAPTIMTSILRALPALPIILCASALAACGSDPTSATDAAGDSTEASTATAGSTSDATASTSSQSDADASGSTGADSTTTGIADTGEDTNGEDTNGEDTNGEDTNGEDTTGVGDEANVLYVRSDGADGNPGTSAAPMRTIQWAITSAEASGVIDTIRVAEGEYGYDFANADHIVMVEGISLFGGYRDDWAQRDPAQYPTNLVDQSPQDVPTSPASPHRAVEIPATVTGATILDGFHIGASHGEYRTAIWAAGAATIRGNTIAVELVDGQYQWGIYVDGADAVVTGNRVAWIGPEGIATAIELHDGSATVANNLLDLTANASNAVGVRISLGTPRVIANTIAIAANGQAVGIVYDSGAAPVLENNIVEAADNTATCLRQNGGASPSSLRNNVLDCQYTLHRINVETPASYGSIAELEAAVPGAQDNLKLGAAVTLGAPDFALGGTTPCTVSRGGLDLSADVPDDIDGLARTAPLSIGAHEWDGACR
jgi:hypothetical protein